MPPVRSHLITLLAAVTTLGIGVGVSSEAAGAATAPTKTGGGSATTPATLEGIKSQGAADITDRVSALNAAIAKVNAATGLGTGQATLASYLGADIAPMQQLDQTIQSDSTVQQAGHDVGTIFSNFRVYVLVLSASRIAGQADHTTTTAIPNLTAAASKAQAKITPADQATLQPLLDDLNSQISAASHATNGLASTVLADTPAQWDADNSLLAAPKTSIRTASRALQQGHADVAQIVQDLKGSRHHAGSPTTS